MNLRDIVEHGHFRGIIVVPDLHDNIHALVDVIALAETENLFIVSLGDINDGDSGIDPTLVTEAMLGLLDTGKGAFVHGNHDNKYYRYAKGNNVTFNKYNHATLSRITGSVKHFFNLHYAIGEHQRSDYYAFYDNFFFTHAIAVRAIWKQETMNRDEKSRLMHGITTGERDSNDYPVRLYTWLNQIPDGKVVFVGHDRSPLGNKITGGVPFINSNTNGSKVFFMDTGCGKGGHLTTAILTLQGDRLTFSKFQKF